MGPLAIAAGRLTPWEMVRHRLMSAALWLVRYLGQRDVRFGD
jgi:hypothetical protein